MDYGLDYGQKRAKMHKSTKKHFFFEGEGFPYLL